MLTPGRCAMRPRTGRRAALWRRLLGQDSGIAMVEFALIMPVLLLLVMGGLELSRYVLLHQKLSRLASNAGDLVSRAEKLTVADVNQVFEASQYIVRPFDMNPEGVVVISSVAKQPDNPPIVQWQQQGGGGASATSQIGRSSQPANLPGTFVLRDFQDVIVAEVFYRYEPLIFDDIFPPADLYFIALQRPRYGALTELLP